MMVSIDRFRKMNSGWDGESTCPHPERVWQENYDIVCGVEESLDGRFPLGGGVHPGDTVEISDGFMVYDRAQVESVDRFGICHVCESGSAFTDGKKISVSGGAFHRIHESRFVRKGYGRNTVWTWGRNGSGCCQGIYFPLLVQHWVVPYDKPKKAAMVIFRTGKCDPMARVVVDPGFLSFGRMFFRSVSAFKAWAEYTGFGYEKSGTSNNGCIIRRAEHNLASAYFNSAGDLPEGAKPLYCMSNGSMVTCYATNDGDTVTVWRPNPNSKEVYKPLPWDEGKKYMGNPMGVRI